MVQVEYPHPTHAAVVSKISSCVQGRCPRLHQHGRHLSFLIEIHNVQGYLLSENVDALVGSSWLVVLYGWWQPCQLPEVLLCFYCYIDVAFVIPSLSEF